MSNLSSTAGTVALIAGGIAVVSLVIAVFLVVRLHRFRRDQLAVLGEGPAGDVVAYVRALERGIDALAARVEDLGARTEGTARRVDGAVTHCGVVRYDAYNEMSGRQSSSVALLDDHRNGVVLSSILHREQARLYAKGITGGSAELGLSPEEQEAVDAALAGRQGQPT